MKKPGPRPRGPYVNRRKAFTARLTEETRGGLDRAAKMSGRSLSQEVEFRLERSLSDDAVMDMLSAMTERLERIERVLWECIQYTPDGTAALEGGLVTPKEAAELCYTADELYDLKRR